MMKRALALLLCLMMLLSLLPTAFSADEALSSEDTVLPASEEGQEELLLPEGEEIDEEPSPVPEDAGGDVPVRVVFVTEPEDAEVTVYDHEALDENGEPLVIEQEEDESWLLVPGKYFRSLSADGFEPVVREEFEVVSPEDPARTLEVRVTMTALGASVEPDGPAEAEDTVRVVFVTEPEGAAVTVTVPLPEGDEGEAAPVAPEEDGSFLLLPGLWLYSAEAEGFEPLTDVEFSVDAPEDPEAALEIPVALTALPPAGPEEPAETEDAVRVIFVTEPENAAVTVTAPLPEGEEGEAAPVAPEEDGSFLLSPGLWLYSAEAEGFEPLTDVEFSVEAPEDPEAALEIPVALTALPPAEPVRVRFVCEPELAVVTVFDPAQRNELGEPAVVAPEEDGTYLLVPGLWLYSAEAEDFTSLVGVEFTVEAQDDPAAEQTVEVMLYPAAHTHEEFESIRVVFICTPADTVVTLYDALLADESGAPLAIAPEEDGSWLLAPGSYLFSAEAEGCVPIERAPLRVDASTAVEGVLNVPIQMVDPEGNPVGLDEDATFMIESIGNLGSFSAKIAAFRSAFPHGRYWDHRVTRAGYSAWQNGDESYQNSVTSYQCNHSAAQVGYYDCNYFDYGYQCHGFAAKLFYELYGVRQTSCARLYNQNGVQVGDFVRLNNDSHAALVIARNGNYITLAEANTGKPGQIYWDRQVNISTITYYKHPPAANYDAVMGPSQETINFVKRCYTQILNRNGDADGIRYWSYELLYGRETGASVVNGFITSPEFYDRGLSNASVVTILYRTMLNRDPDSGGLADWKALLDLGVSYSYIVNGFANAPEFRNLCASYGINPGSITLTEPRDQNLNVTSYVSRCYRLILNRNPDIGGLNDWCSQLLSKRATGASIVDGFITSTEFKNRHLANSSVVEVIYKVMLDRASDPGGKADWVACLTAGATPRCVVNGFANAPEFKNLCASYGITPGALTNLEWRDRNGKVTQFVYRCYYYALGRSADTAGLNDWCQKLILKRLTPAQVAEQFVFSQECVGRSLTDSAFITMLYRLYMGRTPSTAERNDWLSQMNGGMSRQQVNAIFAGSQEFRDIVRSYGL